MVRLPISLLVVAALLSGAAPPPAAVPTSRPPDFVADLVARSFFRALADGDAETLATVCDSSFSFDGETLSGPAAHSRLASLRGRFPPPQRVVVLSAAEATARFGPPPARLAALLERLGAVAFARLSRGGLVAFLTRRQDRWKVIGLSD